MFLGVQCFFKADLFFFWGGGRNLGGRGGGASSPFRARFAADASGTSPQT